MTEGIYEQLINGIVANKLKSLDTTTFFISKKSIDKNEASTYLSSYIHKVLKNILDQVKNEDPISEQINICNSLISHLREIISKKELSNDLEIEKGELLTAIFSKLNIPTKELENRVKEITPYSRLSQSDLFTGANSGISLESELKKEILSSNKICLLISFIKWTGIRIIEKELKEFTEKGGILKIITTTYLGATDFKAIEALSKLKNTQIKISYNTKNDRLHAKAYLFNRNTGFHTAYIGSSNLSRAALTNGLEWNLKITTQEISHVISKFENTFQTYWENKEFELFNLNTDIEKLKIALQIETTNDNDLSYFFDIKPEKYQEEILEKLETEREIHNRFRNLIVAATGTGKTVIAAFDFKRYLLNNPKCKLLFIAHRKEILKQALFTFRGVLKDNNFGDLWYNNESPKKLDHVFASVQILNNRITELGFSKEYFDFIIIDEVHHLPANSYQEILDMFKPKILLGLTATPERMDQKDILVDFCNTIAAEIRLPEALNHEFLCPFQYFGISDSVDLSNFRWEKGRYLPSELNTAYVNNNRRAEEIQNNLIKYLNDINDVTALCFCASIDHAKYMHEMFIKFGLKSDYLVSTRNNERDSILNSFTSKEINYLFVVDIFNEGVDIPQIDTILFLRPTESLTIFLQQFGRGLRKHPRKECLTVLDFVGNANPEYDFEGKFRSLIGKTRNSVEFEIKHDFPHLPLGCSITLERIAKNHILDNIKRATSITANKIVTKIINYKHVTNLPFNLKNFTSVYNIPLHSIYKKNYNWSKLCKKAGLISDYQSLFEAEISRAISLKWLSCNSYSYFSFLLNLAKKNFQIKFESLTESEIKMCLMLHYDVWQEHGKNESLEKSISSIGENSALVMELIEFFEMRINQIGFIEKNILLPYSTPLKLHSRYTRDQILSAFGVYTFNSKPSYREGVVNIEHLNTELLFVTLEKNEKDFSPTTLYNDFAISETIFHWQSQNSAKPEEGKGKSYITHKRENKIILLFVRERNSDENGLTMGYVFLGLSNYIEHTGSKPMSIKWELEEPIPTFMWNCSAKLAIG